LSTALSRVTVMSAHRHLDLRLPSDEPLASLIPQILTLLHDGPPDAPPQPSRGTVPALITSSVLTTSLGSTLDVSHTLRQSGIVDGALLYLRDERDVPPAPEVYDVPSFAAAATERMPALWSGTMRTVGLAAVAGLLLAGSSTAAVLLQGTGPGGSSGTLTGIMFAAALILLGGPVMRLRALPAGVALTAAGAAVSVTTAAWATADPGTGALVAVGAITLAMAAMAAGTGKYVPWLSSAGLLSALGGTWALVNWSTSDAPLAAGLAGIAGIFTLGVAPRMATAIAGLSGLDDDQRQGRRITRRSTLDAVHSAHGALTGWTLISSAVTATAAAVTATAADRPVWAALLPLALLGALTFRGLSLPLLAQRAGVYVAAAAGFLASVIVLARAAEQPFLLAGAAGMGLLVLAASAARVRDQTAARLRVVAARIELCCVLSTIPLVLGLSGAYTQLGQTFG
jgi:ESX secretion system protein EccD